MRIEPKNPNQEPIKPPKDEGLLFANAIKNLLNGDLKQCKIDLETLLHNATLSKESRNKIGDTLSMVQGKQPMDKEKALQGLWDAFQSATQKSGSLGTQLNPKDIIQTLVDILKSDTRSGATIADTLRNFMMTRTGAALTPENQHRVYEAIKFLDNNNREAAIAKLNEVLNSR